MNILNKKAIAPLMLFICVLNISADYSWETFKNYLPNLTKKNIIIGGITAVGAYFLIKKMFSKHVTTIRIYLPNSVRYREYIVPKSWQIPTTDELTITCYTEKEFNPTTKQKRLRIKRAMQNTELFTVTTQIDNSNNAIIRRNNRDIAIIDLSLSYPMGSIEYFIIQAFSGILY